MLIRVSLVVALLSPCGCGSDELRAEPAPRPVEAPPAAPRAASEPEPAARPPGAEPASDETVSPPEDEPRPEEDTATPAACARTRVGLDLRALPVGAPSSQIDLFVRFEAWELAGTQGPSPRPVVRTWPGTGAFEVTFGADSEAEAMQRCEAAVRAYLVDAPRRAGTQESAASVTEECEPVPCEPA